MMKVFITINKIHLIYNLLYILNLIFVGPYAHINTWILHTYRHTRKPLDLGKIEIR